MEEGLLSICNADEEEETSSSAVTSVIVQSTLVALCGSLSTGCAVGPFTHFTHFDSIVYPAFSLSMNFVEANSDTW